MNQKEKLWKNIDYIRGFKDALEWCLTNANNGTVKELVDKIAKLHVSVSVQHQANVQKLFPSFSSLLSIHINVYQYI